MQYFGFDRSSFGFKTFGFGGSEVVPEPIWTPLDLFKGDKQGVWYDPSDLSTLFQDAAGTVPVTANGDPVGKMLDKSGNGNHAVQTLSAARPVYRTDGVLHWLNFDGVDDYLEILRFSAVYDTQKVSVVNALNIKSQGVAVFFSTRRDFRKGGVWLNIAFDELNWLVGYVAAEGEAYINYQNTNVRNKQTKQNSFDFLNGGLIFETNDISVNQVIVSSNTRWQYLDDCITTIGCQSNIALFYLGDWYGSVITNTDLSVDKATIDYLNIKSGITL